MCRFMWLILVAAKYLLAMGFVFSRDSVGIPPKPKEESGISFKVAKWELDVKRIERLQKIMTVDYKQVLLEIAGAAAICGIGYVATSSSTKTSD